MELCLEVLKQETDERARSTVRGRAWPCRRGCDICCRRLATPPQLTEPEWRELRAGIELLPAPVRDSIDQRIEKMPGSGPIVCPMLDREEGACLVYDHRPLACRTYGFYRERDRGQYCGEIEGRVDRGDYEDVVWGNADGFEARQRQLGEMSDLRTWWMKDGI
jgi:Fe-S-cluster containining protein